MAQHNNMSNIIFISDLHLSPENGTTLADFQQFLVAHAAKADKLFILGDLFEAWIGDDNIDACTQAVAKSLQALKKQGKKIYYMHGNRDFLLGNAYAEQCGMEVLPDPFVLKVDGQKIVLTHGDLLCTDDHSYQKFRRTVHQPWLQKLFLRLPLVFRQKIACFLRSKSMNAGPKKSSEMMDVNEAAVTEVMVKYGCKVMIHGHTHKPARHELDYGRRYVLGAWDEKFAILHYEDGDFFLQFSP